MIQLKGISKIYKAKKQEVHAVNQVNLEIHEGEIFGIIGYSGAGKSTLIRMLNQLEKPTEGIIEVGGYQMHSISGSELRKARQEIGMIFQHFNLLWSRTVFENVSFPLEIAGVSKEERKNRVMELIRLVGLEGREDAYPSELSGGQKQRVGIARALANSPKVLLCDEATSALDPETTDQILDLLVDINRKLKLTIVLITHEMHVIQKICDRVAVMENGRVVEMGDILQVFKAPKEEITKRFVTQIVDPHETTEVLEHLRVKYPHGKLLRVKFLQDEVEEPIVSAVIKRFDAPINILHGKITQTAKGSYGTLIVHVDAPEGQLKEIIQFLEENRVEAEVLD